MQKRPSSSPRAAARRQSGPGGLTTPQILVLVLAAVLGSAALFLAAVFLFSPVSSAANGGPTAPAQAAGGAAAVPPRVITTPTIDPAGGSPAAGTEAPVPTIPPLVVPDGCAQTGQPVQLASSPRLIDSATIEVTLDSGTTRGSFAGIEIEPGSSAAQVWLAGVLQGQTLVLTSDPNNPPVDGTPDWYIFAGGRFINEELVRQGFARTNTGGPALACVIQFQQSEQIARVDQLGIWQPTPVPTATFLPFVTLAPQQQPCDCAVRPECGDFTTRSAAQACYNACNDYNSRLDEDRDGLACESLP